MAQKRMIDKKISVSEQVANLSTEAQLLFTWMIPHADDIGLLPYSSRTIKALVVPMNDKILSEDIGIHLESMRKQGLITVFEWGGKKYWYVVNFLNNQTLKKDRQPQTILSIQLSNEAKKSWEIVEKAILETNGNQMEDNGNQMETEVKEEKGREVNNIGKAQELKNDTKTSKPQMASIKDILSRRASPAQSSSKITRSWQEKAFREMEYIGIHLEDKDKARVFKIYKEESEGKMHKATTERVISYLSDYPSPLSYDAKLKMFFKLISNGFTPFEN